MDPDARFYLQRNRVHLPQSEAFSNPVRLSHDKQNRLQLRCPRWDLPDTTTHALSRGFFPLVLEALVPRHFLFELSVLYIDPVECTNLSWILPSRMSHQGAHQLGIRMLLGNRVLEQTSPG